MDYALYRRIRLKFRQHYTIFVRISAKILLSKLHQKAFKPVGPGGSVRPTLQENKLNMIRNYFSLMLFLLLANHALNAQMDSSEQLLFNQIFSKAELEYGIDQVLINGPLYENRNPDVTGLPYLLNYYTNQGSVVYRGKQHANLNLRYDIYNQQVLLIYLFDSVEYKLHLQKEFITEFNLENRRFINEAFGANEDAKFYQVIGGDFPIRILYYWQKGQSNVYVNNPDIKMYSPEQKETYILFNNKLERFKGNMSFTRKLKSKSKTTIKEYLRKNNIKVQHASDDQMELLIKFINTLEK